LNTVLQIDASLDWMQVNAGQVLWRPGDVSDSFYIVINGRLRIITEKEVGGITIVGECGQGDTVGELDVITGSPRRTTVHAIRDTELIRMPQTLFNAISARSVLPCTFSLERTDVAVPQKSTNNCSVSVIFVFFCPFVNLVPNSDSCA
jgi:CRP-like cAMP-binding protein